MAKLEKNWAEMEKKLKNEYFFKRFVKGILRKMISHKSTLSEYMTIY